MPNIAQALREEIVRLARKENKTATRKLRKDTAELKRTAADHKRRIAQLERDNRRLLADAEERRKESVKASDEEIQNARITPKMIQGTRGRLGLSQSDLAELLGVSAVTVYQWEHKEGRLSFRNTEAKAAFIEVRKLKVPEAKERLATIREKAAKTHRRK